MKSMNDMSLTELRGIAQSYQISDVFQKEKHILIQDIELKQKKMVPDPPIAIPQPQYDARLMTKPPSRSSSVEDIETELRPYIDRGLHLSFPFPEVWAMQYNVKEDTGSIRQPLRNIIECAKKIMVTGIVRE